MKTISEVRKEGIQALTNTLGPVDMARFIQSFETGSGDYTKERHEWLPDNLDEVKSDLIERQKKRKDKETSLNIRPKKEIRLSEEDPMSAKTLHQIQQEGLDVLVEKLGPDDAIRFFQIYETGSGDWTKDRKKILDNDPDKIIKSIMERRKKSRLRKEYSLFFLSSLS